MGNAAVPSTRSDWAEFRPGPMTGVTLLNAHFRDHAFERHSHESYCVAVTLAGVQTFHCRGGLHVSLPGDVILFNPDEAHDGRRGTDAGYGYSMMYVDAAVMAECAGSDSDCAAHAPPCFVRPVVHDVQLSLMLRRAVSAVEACRESLRAQELTRRALALLLRRHAQGRGADLCADAGARRMNAVRDYLHEHFSADITVESLAARAGLSRSHLSSAFERHFGVPPHAFLNAVRPSHARTLMLAGFALADVAAAYGFADQSHFSRRFKGSFGIAPAAWLRQMRADQTVMPPETSSTAPLT